MDFSIEVVVFCIGIQKEDDKRVSGEKEIKPSGAH
jgi:hypothetical protein